LLFDRRCLAVHRELHVPATFEQQRVGGNSSGNCRRRRADASRDSRVLALARGDGQPSGSEHVALQRPRRQKLRPQQQVPVALGVAHVPKLHQPLLRARGRVTDIRLGKATVILKKIKV
jgi:hypothetical protein